MSVTPRNDKQEPRKTLHLHGKDFENLEAQPEPVDHAADEKIRRKFEGENFYRPSGLPQMLKAEKETMKFNKRTREARVNPEINHDRMTEEDLKM
ncbi:MAG: hypothetical protein ACAH80_16050 [Alphaproteobacteria bacterium]